MSPITRSILVLGLVATAAVSAGCSSSAPDPMDGGPDASIAEDGGPDASVCVAQCDACALSYCSAQCVSVHAECIMSADGDCDAIRRCIMGPVPP